MPLETMRARRTIRKYTDEKLSDDQINELLLAAMYAPSAWGKKSWEFIVVEDEDLRKELSALTPYASQARSAPVNIVVMSNKQTSSNWIEDSAIAAEHIILAAAKLGLGTSWVQVRGMKHNGLDAESYLKEMLGIPENYGVCCMVTVGYPAEEKSAHREGEFEEEKVHYNRFGTPRAQAA